MRSYRYAFFACTGLALLAACTGQNGQPAASQTAAPVKLASVGSAPAPSLPSWIASVSPTSNDVTSLSQVRVLFNKPVAKVEALEGDGPADVLSHVRIEPDIKGHFVLLTPKMIAFVADQALPLATRVRITLTAGLKDVDGDALATDLPWSFETQSIALDDVPQPKPSASDEPTPDPVNLHPTITISSNVELDPQSLGDHATLTANGTTVGMTAVPHATPSPGDTPDPGATAGEAYDASQRTYRYDLQPKNDLAKATSYTLTIASGVEPAIGNLPLATAVTGGVRTYDTLAIVATPSPGPTPGGRFANGDPVIAFTNPIDDKTAAANVTVSPAPANVKQLVSVTGNQVAINPYALDPNASYSVTIGGGIKDTFGQTLGDAKTVTVKTADFAPGIWAPTGQTSLPAGGNVKINVYGTNLPGNNFRALVRPLDPQTVLANGGGADALGSWKTWPTVTLDAKPNQQSVVPLALPAPFGTFAYGVKSSLSDDPLTGTVTLTNLGIHAQAFPARATVMAQHLSDGAPASNVALTVYRMPSGDGSPQSCASGRTDSSGRFDLSEGDLARCYSGAGNDAPALGIIATEGSDVATLRLDSWSGAYIVDGDFEWTGGAPRSQGTVFTDRQLYQPGERVELTGIAYYAMNGKIQPDRNSDYAVSISDSNGKAVATLSAHTDAYGTFSTTYPLGVQQALGYYSISAKGPNGVVQTGSFRVAEFRPPNFKLDVALDKASATPGSSVSAQATAAYLFGAPLQGGKAHATITRAPADLQPKGWDEYTFGRRWFWPERQPSVTSAAGTQDATFDRDGKASFNVSVPGELQMPLQYTVSVDASDVSNVSVSNAQTFLALPEDGVIGLQSDYIGKAGTAIPVKTIVTGVNGKAISGRSVHLVLQKITYVSASQSNEGGEEADETAKYDDVASADVTPGDSAATAQLTPTDAGSYRIRANFSGAKSDASATDELIYVAGANSADFGNEDKAYAKISLDKKNYRVGDTATAVVASPFDEADAYVAVVRSDVLYQTTVKNVKGAPTISFRVTPDMVPNAALQVVLVRRGAPLASVKPGALTSLERTGMATFSVDVADRYAKLTIVPGQAKTTPGSHQSVAFSLDGPARGHAKVIAMVVNDAVLQLSGYRLPDLVKTVYAEQPIATRFADSRRTIRLETETAPAEKGFGYGGGMLGAAADTRVRRNFQPLAYYGSAVTDENGRASVSFNVPDDLTTWRVMAVAIGNDDAHFGTADGTFVATQPVLTNPLLPQIARPGDQFQGGLSILTTNGGGSATIDASLSGAVRFASGDPAHAQGTAQASDTLAAFRLPMVAGTPAPSTATFTTHVNGGTDAFTVPIVIRERGVTESVIQSGVASSRTQIPIDVSHGGTLQITLANSAVTQIAAPAAELFARTWYGGASSSEAASRLVAAAALETLAPAYHLSLQSHPSDDARAALTDLLATQRSDGGFGYVKGAKESDPFASAYALDALAFANAHGVSVPSGAIDRASDFASKALADPTRWKWCTQGCLTNLRFDMLVALADKGDRRTDFLQQIVDDRAQLDSATQIRLARYLLDTPGYNETGNAMAAKLKESVYLTGRYAVATQPLAWSWFDSAPQAQAEMVQLFVQMHAPADQIDGAARQLAAQDCKCGWPTSYDAAAALRAMTAYAKAGGVLQAGDANVTANGKTLASANFTAGVAQSQTQTIAASDVNAANLTIDAHGSAHYTIVYTYPVAKDAPGALSAFRITRYLREIGNDTPIATFDLSPVKDPLTVDAGRVFDVGVRVAVDHPVNDLMIDDAVPAGFEAVDATFATSNPSLDDRSSSWQLDEQQVYADRVTAHASSLQPGIYELHYLVRSVTPGTFAWPGGQAYMLQAPEQFGRTASGVLIVK